MDNHIRLPYFLKNLASIHVKSIIEELEHIKLISLVDKVELEFYPVRNDHGQLTWAFSRWKLENMSK